ncbi:hypothetical protein NKH87_18285 [Mesorhizobium australicum]
MKVGSDLQVVGHPDIFALGDVALFNDESGQSLPGLAQVAKQQGEHLGKALARRIDTGDKLPAFAFGNRGNTAIAGRHAAVFDSGRLKLKRWLAWSAWGDFPCLPARRFSAPRPGLDPVALALPDI